MTFTQDELQAFNAILELRLTAQQREIEQAMEQRLFAIRDEMNRRITTFEQGVKRELAEQLRATLPLLLDPKLEDQQDVFARVVQQKIEANQQQQQQQLQATLENSLAAHLLGIEQIVGQRLSSSENETSLALIAEQQPDFNSIELHTEIPWDDLVSAVDKVLDERMSALYNSLLAAFKNTERYLLEQLRGQRGAELAHYSPQNDAIGNMRELFSSIEQLERIVESMQVAMTANHALLSNRLYHHLNLPSERAHPSPGSHNHSMRENHLSTTDRASEE